MLLSFSNKCLRVYVKLAHYVNFRKVLLSPIVESYIQLNIIKVIIIRD